MLSQIYLKGSWMFNQNLEPKDRKELLSLTKLAVDNFNQGDWLAIGVYTGQSHFVEGHDRLLRSLSFGDPDYSGCAHAVMNKIVLQDLGNLKIISDYIQETYQVGGMSVSSSSNRGPQLTFAPSVFEIPTQGPDSDLIAVMSPFSQPFEAVFTTIEAASMSVGFRCLRAKDIWEHSSVIQDVFSLIFKAHIVVCDFTGKNPNVFYEAGIAHTLRKHVVPITQSASDIPFDLQHHRYLSYLNNNEGLTNLKGNLKRRFEVLK